MGKNFRTAASLMMATFGAGRLSRSVKPRPLVTAISIVSKKFGAMRTRLIVLLLRVRGSSSPDRLGPGR